MEHSGEPEPRKVVRGLDGLASAAAAGARGWSWASLLASSAFCAGILRRAPVKDAYAAVRGRHGGHGPCSRQRSLQAMRATLSLPKELPPGAPSLFAPPREMHTLKDVNAIGSNRVVRALK